MIAFMCAKEFAKEAIPANANNATELNEFFAKDFYADVLPLIYFDNEQRLQMIKYFGEWLFQAKVCSHL